MAGLPGANLFISRVLGRSAGETAGNRFHAREHLKDRLGAPETAAPQGRGFRFIRRVHIFWLRHCGQGAEQSHRQEKTGCMLHSVSIELVWHINLSQTTSKPYT